MDPGTGGTTTPRDRRGRDGIGPELWDGGGMKGGRSETTRCDRSVLPLLWDEGGSSVLLLLETSSIYNLV